MCSIAVALLLALVQGVPDGTDLGLAAVAGHWKPAIDGGEIAALEIQVGGTRVTVHAWSACTPQDCDWGEAEAQSYGPRDARDTIGTTALSVVFPAAAGDKLLLLFPTGADGLHVELLARFNKDSGQNYRSVATLVREGSPIAAAPASVGPAASGATPVRVGGPIKEPKKLKNVAPRYPDAAKHDRIQGRVILECVISTEGRVTDVRVLRGVPELVDAAVDAVRQWEYTTTLLYGVPVPVIMTVTVSFHLS